MMNPEFLQPSDCYGLILEICFTIIFRVKGEIKQIVLISGCLLTNNLVLKRN